MLFQNVSKLKWWQRTCSWKTINLWTINFRLTIIVLGGMCSKCRKFKSNFCDRKFFFHNFTIESLFGNTFQANLNRLFSMYSSRVAIWVELAGSRRISSPGVFLLEGSLEQLTMGFTPCESWSLVEIKGNIYRVLYASVHYRSHCQIQILMVE